MTFQSLQEATRRYRLKNPALPNSLIASSMGPGWAVLAGDGLNSGKPFCCLYIDGQLAAIRIKDDELAVFHAFPAIQQSVMAIADPIDGGSRENVYRSFDTESMTPGIFYACVMGNGLHGLVSGSSQDEVNREASRIRDLLNRGSRE